MRTEYAGLINEKFIGQTVTLYGWAHRRRDHGGVIFIDLRDREGLLQVVCDPDRPDVFATAEAVRNEFCLKVVSCGLVLKARSIPISFPVVLKFSAKNWKFSISLKHLLST